MNKKHRGLRLAALTAALTALLAVGLSASATPGFEPTARGRLVVVGEPDNMSQYVEFYKGEEEHDTSELTWVEGRFGQGVKLDGVNEYLRLWRQQLSMSEMTFSGWINWQGAADGQPAETAYGQRFFTLSRAETNWLTFSPRMRNPEKTDENGNILDSVYVGLRRGRDFERELFQYAEPDVANFALPQNEWHHVAVTMDGFSLKLYIDGALWMEQGVVMQVLELQPLQFTVGGTIFDTATLNAVVDEVYLYNYALDADGIAKLAAGVDPMDPEATVPSEEPYLPTAPQETQPVTPPTEVTYVTRPAQHTSPLLIGTVFGLPKLTVLVVGGILGLFIVLCIGLNIYHFVHDRREAQEKTDDANQDGGDGA